MKFRHLMFSIFFFSLLKISEAQIAGCTDPLAVNFNPSATQNDGSCTYSAASITPEVSFNLTADVTETSGLIIWNSNIWTFNDSYDNKLYSLDTLNGNPIQAYTLKDVDNYDWEEISQDADFVYVGDFGNNANGNRTNLRILKIDKNSILTNSPKIDIIYFSYSDQTDFSAASSNNTDFDCEAFIVTSDSIYLFTKKWLTEQTSVYALPKTPGTFTAKLKSTYDVQGLITGATYLESKKLVVLSGYSILLQPFAYLLYDYNGSDFFTGNKRKIEISLPYHPVGGIATYNGLKYYISNEHFVQAPYLDVPQKLHILDLTNYLGNYINKLYNSAEFQPVDHEFLFPNPAGNFVYVKSGKWKFPAEYSVINQSGQVVSAGKLVTGNQGINVSGLAAGTYFLDFSPLGKHLLKLVKR